jgi:hypothetical protein
MSINDLLSTPPTGPNTAAAIEEMRSIALAVDADLHMAHETVASIPVVFRGSKEECEAHARAYKFAIEQLKRARQQQAEMIRLLEASIRAAQRRDRAALLLSDD